MKKILLSAAAVCIMAFSANSQAFEDGATGFVVDYTGTDATYASCLATNIAVPNNGGYNQPGGNITNTGLVEESSAKFLKFTSTAGPDLVLSVTPAYYDIYSIYSDACNTMRMDATGVTMGSNAKASITAKASTAGAVLRVYLGSSADQGYPFSTYNTGATGTNYIIWEIPLTTSYATYTYNFTANSSEAAIWNAWSGRNMINMLGFTAGTASTTYSIQKVALGSTVLATTAKNILPSSVTYGPNPSADHINVDLSSLNMNDATLKLMNSNGAVVKEVSNASSISVAELNSGLYFLQINNYAPVKVVVE